jgi:hypothetical protein
MTMPLFSTSRALAETRTREHRDAMHFQVCGEIGWSFERAGDGAAASAAGRAEALR